MPRDDGDVKGKSIPPVMCVGIGTYQTLADGELYLCILIDPNSLQVISWSVGVYRSAELVGKALERLYEGFADYPPCVLRTSRNVLYREETFSRVIAPFPIVHETTIRGVRGGVFVVSTFFSQLMRRRGRHPFSDWQQAIDWLSRYVNTWNKKHDRTVV